MHAEKLLHRWLSDVLPMMHRTRRKALGAVISGAFLGGRLTVTGLGRAIRSAAREKHSIKRADRLLSNQHLQEECFDAYACVAQQVIGRTKQPIILVDWSDVDARREFFILRAATPAQGRSITLYEEVHDRSTKERRSTHNTFLERLEEILSRQCIPVIVTDAGFRTPWFKKVSSFGWDFVGRVRNREMVQLTENQAWIGAKSLYTQATSRAKLLTEAWLTRSNPIPCSLVLFRSKPKGRVRLGRMGKKKRNRTSLVRAVRAKEPWLLATSLSASSKRIVRIYSLRMQIEEAFRDLKCPRCGLSLYQNGTYKIERLKVLLLIGTLTTTFAWLLGKTAKNNKVHRHFQANTVRSTNVLSTVFIGIQVFRDFRIRFTYTSFRQATKQIVSTVQELSYA